MWSYNHVSYMILYHIMYALVFRVDTIVRSNKAMPSTEVYCPIIRLLPFHICLYIVLYLIEFLANTIGFNIICKDYHSINQHFHPSTATTGPQGGRLLCMYNHVILYYIIFTYGMYIHVIL